ncbi:HAD family hydrolase [Hydrogenimonas sp.]
MKEIIILFDLDGTLIDSTDAILESFAAAYGSFGSMSPEREAIEALIGYPLDVMFSRLGVPESLVKDHVDAYKRHYRVISREKTRLLPGAKEAIEAARSFARLGVVTTKTARYSKELLEHMDLIHYFEVLIGREDVVNPKPHPEPICLALKKMNASAKNVWMVGDTLLDIEAARAAGVEPVAVACGYGETKLLANECKMVFDDAKSAIDGIALKVSLPKKLALRAAGLQ